MGMFKQVKQMKEAVAGAPALIEQAQELQAAALGQQAAAQQLAAQHQAAAAAAGVPAGGIGAGIAPAPAPGALSDADLAPIGGVSLDLYVELSRELGARGYTLEQAPALAAERGIAAADWHAAVDGWNGRMGANPAVALEFNRLYQGG
jgi:hypothetical protein